MRLSWGFEGEEANRPPVLFTITPLDLPLLKCIISREASNILIKMEENSLNYAQTS